MKKIILLMAMAFSFAQPPFAAASSSGVPRSSEEQNWMHLLFGDRPVQICPPGQGDCRLIVYRHKESGRGTVYIADSFSTRVKYFRMLGPGRCRCDTEEHALRPHCLLKKALCGENQDAFHCVAAPLFIPRITADTELFMGKFRVRIKDLFPRSGREEILEVEERLFTAEEAAQWIGEYETHIAIFGMVLVIMVLGVVSAAILWIGMGYVLMVPEEAVARSMLRQIIAPAWELDEWPEFWQITDGWDNHFARF